MWWDDDPAFVAIMKVMLMLLVIAAITVIFVTGLATGLWLASREALGAPDTRPEPPARPRSEVPGKPLSPCVGFYVTRDEHGDLVMKQRDLPPMACLLTPLKGWHIELRERQ